MSGYKIRLRKKLRFQNFDFCLLRRARAAVWRRQIFLDCRDFSSEQKRARGAVLRARPLVKLASASQRRMAHRMVPLAARRVEVDLADAAKMHSVLGAARALARESRLIQFGTSTCIEHGQCCRVRQTLLTIPNIEDCEASRSTSS